MSYIPIFLQLLKELPHQVVEKVPLVTSRHHGIDRKKGRVQNVTCSVALTIRNLYDYKTKEYVDVLTSQSLSL